MIRQAISCDICGTEMLSPNHWFVAYDRGPELRIAAWNREKRSRTAARHLCGHKCLHKLVDDFMARVQSAGSAAEIGTSNLPEVDQPAPPTDSSLAIAAPTYRQQPQVFSVRMQNLETSVQPIASAQHIPSRPEAKTLRAEAWKRERQRVAGQPVTPRRSIA